MAREGPIPIVGYHRGVGLHDGQNEARLAIVRAELDVVIEMGDLRELVAWAEFVGHSPESRLLSGAKALALLGEIGSARQKLPRGLAAEYVQSIVAGLDGEGWRSSLVFGTLLEEGNREAVERETPLER